jgi:DEAD/DEAH box helicase domain-containing protein
VLFVADDSPLDQHFVRRPEELLDGQPEVVYLNPDHKETVLDHLWCAIEELPFDKARDARFWGPNVGEFYQELVEKGRRKGREVLVTGKVGERAKEVKIRSLGFEAVVRDDGGSEVARPDVLRAMRRFHKYARFQIQDRAYQVTRLSINWDEQIAEAVAVPLDRLDYSTASIIQTDCLICGTEESNIGRGEVRLDRGPVRFTVYVDGYYRIPASQAEKPQYQPLGAAAPPRHELDTQGMWVSVPVGWIDDLPTEDRAPSVKTVSESLRIAAALMCSIDPDDVGAHVETELAGMAFRLFLTDNAAGGNGLTHQLFAQAKRLISAALRILNDCPHCKDHPESRGCPRCVTTPWGAETDVCRQGGLAILRRLYDALG